MGKISFVFSGQGAQFAGMGKVFYENCERARNLFNKAEEARPGTIAQCFDGSADELKMTENTQPCLYLADLAAAYALRDSGLQPEAVAGFSLGEIPALAFAGAYDGMTGFRLACARGASMARAGKNVNASMAAIVKLPDETVERAARNLPGVKTTLVGTLNVYEILKYQKLVLTRDSAQKIEEV